MFPRTGWNQKHYEEQQIKYRKKKAAKFGFRLVPA
jgi:hypothetical protein